jgi:cytochrome P450
MSIFFLQDTPQENKANYHLTQEEIISNILIFMLGGYETTSTALACATYEIAKHPDVLEKLRAEIDQLPLDNDDNGGQMTYKHPDYDIVAQMPYMDHFISEVLRMYPISNTVVQRCAAEDTIVQGITIEKGNFMFFR